MINKWDGRYGMQALIAKPNFKRNVVFTENLVACELRRLNVWMTKPIITGAAILDISKCKMYEFHYDFIRQKFDSDHCKLQYTDTDSFLYEFKCDIYKFIHENNDQFDTSGYPKNNPYGIQQLNNKVIGMMKDEYNGKLIKEYVGIRAKLYAIKVQRDRPTRKKGKIVKLTKKGKGVKKNVLKKQISFEDFKKCISDHCTLIRSQSSIKSSLHNVYTITNEKKVLDPFDDKRYIIPNSYNTLAWGHYKIESLQNNG